MNKKASHVGIIASFAIFVTFLAGLYFVLNPILGSKGERDIQLKYVEEILKNKFSDNLSIIVISPTSPSCSNLSLASLGYGSLDAIVKDSNDNVINSEPNGGILKIAPTPESILWVYISPQEFSNTTTSETGCSIPEIKSVRESKEIFESKIISGINNFTSLKEGLDLGASEFGFEFEYENGTVLSTPIFSGDKDVYVKEINVNYIDSLAQKLPGKIRLSVW